MKEVRGDRNFVVGEDVLDSVKISEVKYERVRRREGGGGRRGKGDSGNAGAGKLPRAFCYSGEKFRHADWMIMSLEKCENEPACRSTSCKV